MNKWLESSRQFFYMSMAIFFLSSGGFMVRLMFIEDPFHYLGRRALENEGKMIIDILTNPRTIQAIRSITTPSKKNNQPLERYIVDRLFQKDGAWLRGFLQKTLQDPSVQKLVSTALQSPPSNKPPQEQTAYLLGRYAIDQLLQRDGIALQKLVIPILKSTNTSTKPASSDASNKQIAQAIEQISKYTIDRLLEKDAKILGQLLQQTLKQNASNTSTTSNTESTRLIAASVERVAQSALGKLFEKDASLLRSLLKEALQPNKSTSPTTSSKPNTAVSALEKAQLQMAERLGRYTIDQLLASRAQKLRSILLSLVGPELMRILRESRITLKQLNQQVQGVPLRQLIQDAAFAAGKGATEGFLGAQSQQKQQTERQQRAISLLAPKLRAALSTELPCFVATNDQWMRWQDGALRIKLIRANDKSCKKLTCEQQQQKLQAWLQKQLQPLKLHASDLQIQLGGCNTTAPPNKQP